LSYQFGYYFSVGQLSFFVTALNRTGERSWQKLKLFVIRLVEVVEAAEEV